MQFEPAWDSKRYPEDPYSRSKFIITSFLGNKAEYLLHKKDNNQLTDQTFQHRSDNNINAVNLTIFTISQICTDHKSLPFKSANTIAQRFSSTSFNLYAFATFVASLYFSTKQGAYTVTAEKKWLRLSLS